MKPRATEIEIAAARRQRTAAEEFFAEKIKQGLMEKLAPFTHEPLTKETAARIKYVVVNYLDEMHRKDELPRPDVPKVVILTHKNDPKRFIIAEESDLAELYRRNLIPSEYTVWT